MKIKKLGCILIPELTNKYWFFVLFIIGSLCRKVIPSLLSDYAFKIRKKNIIYEEERREILFDIVCNVASDLLTGIFHCLSEKYTPRKANRNYKNKIIIPNSKKDLKIKFLYSPVKKKKPFKFKTILFISLIDFICQLLFFGNCIIRKNDINKFNDEAKSNVLRNPDFLYSLLVIDIISRYIFSSLILKTYFYDHHNLSFLLNIIAIFILLYVDIKFKIKEYNLWYLLMIILQYILYSLEDILNKVALITSFIRPVTLLFYKGLFCFVYLSILTLLLFFLESIHFPELKITLLANVFCRAYYIIFNIMRSIFLVKVLDFFSSQHISFLRVLETIFLFIFYKFDGYYKKKKLEKNPDDKNLFDNYFHLSLFYELVEFAAFFLLLFGTLIHNEIIIINKIKYRTHTIFFMKIEAQKENKRLHSEVENASIENTQTLSSINDDNPENTNSF